MSKNFDLYEGEFGLEVEAMRIDSEAYISKTDHPQVFQANNPYITKDFAEAQVEMITPPMSSIELAVNMLEDIQSVVLNNLGNDYLWKQSNPPIIHDDGFVQIAKLEDSSDQQYREYLLKTYGVEKSIISGVHFNFSFTESIIKHLYESANSSQKYNDFKNNLYLKVSKYLLNDRWFFIYLTNASPVFHKSFYENCVARSEQIDNGDCVIDGLNSLRNSECGYRNKEEFFINYNSIEDYTLSVSKLISESKITQASELYTPVRLKFDEAGNIQYIEIRFLDVNPFEASGVSAIDLQYLHMYLITKLFADDFDFNNEKQIEANNNHASSVSAVDFIANNYNSMLSIHKEIETFHKDLDSQYCTNEIFNSVLSRINDKEQTYASILKSNYAASSYVDYHLEKAKQFKADQVKYSYELKSYSTLELSTKILIKEAIAQGLEFTLLDINTNFICLRNVENNHKQLIQQATKTNLDKYANVLAMENKIVTKSLLRSNGINVAAGVELYNMSDLSDCMIRDYVNKGVVIKPNTTNFGDGITIYPDGASTEMINQAVEYAFSKDDTVIIEHFITGKEYRFLVVDSEVVAVLHRRSANVIGDGISTISELIDEKNKHEYRGNNYTSPLEYIQKGESERDFLKLQKLDFDSVVALDETIYLRENSNISTGGDSIDVTSLVDESYKDIAVRSSQVLDVSISGVDIIITDINVQANDYNYHVLELNYNPAIHIHTYPLIGDNQYPAKKILQTLFKEREIR